MSAAPSVSPWRRLGRDAALLLAGRLAVAACGLVQVPLAYRSLDREAFGLWIAFSGLFWSLTVLDCGLGFAVQNRVTTLLAGGQAGGAAALARWARNALGFGAAALLAFGLALARWGPWDAWLGIADASLHAQARLSAEIVFAAAATHLPVGLAARLATAAQCSGLNGMWTAASSLAGLAATALAAWRGWPLAGFVAASCVLPLGAGLGAWWSVARMTWWRMPLALPPDRRGIVRQSALFFSPQAGAVAIGAFVPVLVAMVAGPVAAGTFGVLQRLFGFALQLQSHVLLPAWPAYADAAARGEAATARRTFRATVWVSLLAFMLPTMALTPLAPVIVRAWLGGGSPEVPTSLLWAVAGWHGLQFCGQPLAVLLNGAGRLEWPAMLGWISVFATVSLGSWLGSHWGAVGVVAALAGPYALLNLPICVWLARRALAEITAPHASRPAVVHE
jgi:O-antigen/teichoic acid export membrane protein